MCRVCYYCFEVSLDTNDRFCDVIRNSLRHRVRDWPFDCPGCRIWYTCGSCKDETQEVLGCAV
jgi:hypothetical protein